jgi:hypothetical protein
MEEGKEFLLTDTRKEKGPLKGLGLDFITKGTCLESSKLPPAQI